MSTRSAFLISVAVHGAIVGAFLWLSASNQVRPVSDRSSPGNAPQGVADGAGILTLAPPLGPSLSPTQAAPYLGRYIVASPGRPDAELRVTLERNGEDHWSLRISEGQLLPNTLIPVGPDSFVSRLNQEFRVAFVRHDTLVTALDLSWNGVVRRGVKVLGAARE